MRNLPSGLAAAFLLCLGTSSLAAANGILQIYGLELDSTRIGMQFCEETGTSYECRNSKHLLPRISSIEATETPAPTTVLTLQRSGSEWPEKLTIWCLPRATGGQSFLIYTTTSDPWNLETARASVLRSFGDPTVELTHADLEARGLKVSDLTLDTLVFVDPSLAEVERHRLVEHVQKGFNPTGDELFFLADSSLQTLARLLGSDFRGAIVQINESGFGHDSHMTTILLDLKRARSVFNIGVE